MRRHLKSLFGWLALRSGLHRLWFHNKAVIVLFHRVDDSLDTDPISCSRRTFEAYCEVFRRHFIVVSLQQLLDRLARREDISRHLVITFDDGYRDNLEVAAVELSRHRLPACFFIATGFIGTDRAAPWDVAHGVSSRWMSWDDVRRLRQLGFELGAHTIHHVDLGRAAGAEAVCEIQGSRERLERELDAPAPLFSYPFGGIRNITEENRAVVRRAGFTCCLAAFGGIVTPQSDPFRLARIPISGWYTSPFQFAFEAMLERGADPPRLPRPGGVPAGQDTAA